MRYNLQQGLRNVDAEFRTRPKNEDDDVRADPRRRRVPAAPAAPPPTAQPQKNPFPPRTKPMTDVDWSAVDAMARQYGIDTEENGKRIIEFFHGPGHNLEFNLANVEHVIRILLAERKLQVVPKPAAPPEPAATPAPEQLQPGQLSLNASEFELRSATKEQVRDYLRRLRAAQAKK